MSNMTKYDKFPSVNSQYITQHQIIRKLSLNITKKVTVITPTNKTLYLKSVFDDFQSQLYQNKELIIILNNNNLVLNKWKNYSRKFKNISVYQLDEEITLGECLNYAVNKSSGNYLAKFDDDDFYAPNYLEDMLKYFHLTEAKIIGKVAHFVYIENRKKTFFSSLKVAVDTRIILPVGHMSFPVMSLSRYSSSK